jgi:xanthine dehydrogenase accessory factor
MCAIELARAMLRRAVARHGGAGAERYALGPRWGSAAAAWCIWRLSWSMLAGRRAGRPARAPPRGQLAPERIDGPPATLLLDADGAFAGGQWARHAGVPALTARAARMFCAPAGAAGWPILAWRRARIWCCSAPAMWARPSCACWASCRAPSRGWTNAKTCSRPRARQRRIEATDMPEAAVASAAGASYLVMTHSHALDQRLCEAILAREDVGWFGLIGSQTKRVQFERRMAARGLPQNASPAWSARSACPASPANSLPPSPPPCAPNC